VRTTRAATGGADPINREFVEPVQTEKALVLAIEDSALVAERLQTRQRAQERKVVSELDSTNEALARAIAPVLDGGNCALTGLPNRRAIQDTLKRMLAQSVRTIKFARVERAITASLGVAVHPGIAGESETLMRLADRALYAAKAAGRNRVELARAEVPTAIAHNGAAPTVTVE
jgi:GGDEF domain-containing protein